MLRELLKTFKKFKSGKMAEEAVSAQDDYGSTALHAAILADVQEKDKVDIVKELLESSLMTDKAVSAKNKRDRTALHLAAYNGNLEVVEKLLENAKMTDRAVLELLDPIWAKLNALKPFRKWSARKIYSENFEIDKKFENLRNSTISKIRKSFARRRPEPSSRYFGIELRKWRRQMKNKIKSRRREMERRKSKALREALLKAVRKALREKSAQMKKKNE